MEDNNNILENTTHLLHKIVKEPNLFIPYSDFIKPYKFPEQNQNLLNQIVSITYRDTNNAADNKFYNIPSSGRPSDDDPWINPDGSSDDDWVLETSQFKIVRADNEMPYKLIAVSLDYRVILVSSSEFFELEGKYGYEKTISIYPAQLMEYLGLEFMDSYQLMRGKPGHVEGPGFNAYTMRVDAGEPNETVLVELIDDETIRFILGDECFSRSINDGTQYITDSSGRYILDSDNYILADTIIESDSSDDSSSDDDGSFEDDNHFIPNKYLSTAELYSIRKLIIEGKKIYGTV